MALEYTSVEAANKAIRVLEEAVAQHEMRERNHETVVIQLRADNARLEERGRCSEEAAQRAEKEWAAMHKNLRKARKVIRKLTGLDD